MPEYIGYGIENLLVEPIDVGGVDQKARRAIEGFGFAGRLSHLLKELTLANRQCQPLGNGVSKVDFALGPSARLGHTGHG
jgi:hypothetical protein